MLVGTPALARRTGSLVQLSGRNRRRPTVTGTSPRASVSETSVWQLAFLPSDEAYCGATPTECLPFFGSAVSSMMRKASRRPPGDRPRPAEPPPAAPCPRSRRRRSGAAGRGRPSPTRRHRLDALAISRADQARHVERAHRPPRGMGERLETAQPRSPAPHASSPHARP